MPGPQKTGIMTDMRWFIYDLTRLVAGLALIVTWFFRPVPLWLVLPLMTYVLVGLCVNIRRKGSLL